MLDTFHPNRCLVPQSSGGLTPRALRRYLGSSGAVTSSPRVACLYVFPLTTILLAKAQFAESPEDGTQRAGAAFVFGGAKRSESYPPQSTLEFSKARISVKNHRLRGENWVVLVFPRYGVLLRVRQDRGHHRVRWCKEICPTRSECVAGIVNCCLRLVIRGLP